MCHVSWDFPGKNWPLRGFKNKKHFLWICPFMMFPRPNGWPIKPCMFAILCGLQFNSRWKLTNIVVHRVKVDVQPTRLCLMIHPLNMNMVDLDIQPSSSKQQHCVCFPPPGGESIAIHRCLGKPHWWYRNFQHSDLFSDTISWIPRWEWKVIPITLQHHLSPWWVFSVGEFKV